MSILVTCSDCGADNRVEAVHMVVRFSDAPDDRAAELLFACSACGGVPVQRVRRRSAAVVVLRGGASLVAPDLPPLADTSPPHTGRAAALQLDDLLDLHLQLQGDDLFRFLDECGQDGR